KYPKRLRHTNVTQHFEFGLNKKPIHFGDDEAAERVITGLGIPEERVKAWAVYWNTAYRYILRLQEDPHIAPHIHLLRYEDICARPEETLRALLTFCEISTDEEALRSFASTLHPAAAHDSRFTKEELAAIRAITEKTAAEMGYQA